MLVRVRAVAPPRGRGAARGRPTDPVARSAAPGQGCREYVSHVYARSTIFYD